jgi:hypothetical protein
MQLTKNEIDFDDDLSKGTVTTLLKQGKANRNWLLLVT